MTSAGYDLGASFENVYACGPRGANDFSDTPFEDADYGFQCVELANRFLWDAHAITPVSGGALVGGNFVATVHAKDPSIPVGDSGTAVLPAPGDIISMWGGSSGQGQSGGSSHVAVVTGVRPVATGWTVSLMEQNASANGLNSISVSGGGTKWSYGSGYFTSFDWLSFSTLPPATGGARAVATSDGHIQVFEVAGGVVKQNWYSPATGQVGAWTQSPGFAAQATGTPALVARAGQTVIDAFVRGGDGQVYETWYNWGTGAWGGWIGLGGSVSGDPQAVASSDGHEQVFATGSGVVEQNWFSPSNGAVGGWASF